MKVSSRSSAFLLAGTVMLSESALSAQAFDTASSWMLGDWGGLRRELQEKGYDFGLSYIPEVATNIKGGYDHDRTARYADQFALSSHFDLQKILGIQDADFQLTITERSGRDITNDRLVDPRAGYISSSTQEIYGAGQTWRLTKMWYRQMFFDKALDIKFGRIPVGDDFDTIGCEFQNWAFCGALGGHGSKVWYSAPVSQWAARVKYNFNKDTYWQVGAFEFNPTELEPNNGFKLNTSGRTGTTYLSELGWNPLFGSGYPGMYKLGAYYNTAKTTDALDDANGAPQPLTGLPLAERNNKQGWYAYARQKITADAGDPRRGLSLFAHYSANDKATSMMDYQVELGAIYTGVFASRPEDDLGFAVGALHVNPAFAKRIDLQNQVRGLVDYNDPRYQPERTAEYVAELHYGIKVAPWLTVRPNIQYLANPGGAYQVDDSVVLGVQVMSNF
ncbi:porin [Pseudomonas gingeri NCPPB 3146 = LMG 5327]|uniref:Carbohydrate porin n=2 Tax=Pseudomonas gingeri TaxID=117681 RepID=A0A7Y7Y4P7_9PSED|nr:carbohydrate porin [Pseudomonas gingeri]NWC17851.1 carbohydrate porin [Pseudomonas gingeri]NWE50574.1 carbohydrate porin [Pseudomonas gingeri]PNQ94107.1 porin [Pseudomonas gingeri NCPPB 3146 = LMG 5327]